MADVQIDDGKFTRIANILLEQTAKLHLNGTQYSVVITLWRFTYGFQRSEHELSITFIAKATGISTRAIKKELKNLIDRNIIHVSKENTKADSRVLKFNKDYDTWEQGNKTTPGEQSIPSQGNNQSPQQGNKTTPKKEILKENIKDNIIILNSEEAAFISILETVKNYPIDRAIDIEMYRTLKQRYPVLEITESLKDWFIYKLDKPLKAKDNPRAQVNTWMKKAVEFGKNIKKPEQPKRQITY